MAVNILQAQEIKDLKEEIFQTRRATVPALEEILYDPIKVLDHGFIRVVDYMGDDSAIVQAARVSYGKGTKKVSEDQGLINYLMRHRHSTPFEMCEIKFHVKLPIFVARQWIRHRTANVNEYSARYSILDKEFYIPDPQHLAYQSKINNQGRGDLIEGQRAQDILNLLREDSLRCYEHYQDLIQEGQGGIGTPSVTQEDGLARELARMVLPINYYTQWYWKIDLHNLMHFLALRADPHAQYEIRAYADAMIDILKRWVPFAYQAFLDYRVNGFQLSGKGMAVVRQLIQGEKPTREGSGMTPREWRELGEILQVSL
jgi:thymidylate synthase (FAD)